MREQEFQLPPGVLIADAGGTKVDWAIGGSKGRAGTRTKGIHPYFQDADSIFSALESEQESFEIDPEAIDRIHFYGAGCSSEERKQRVKKGVAAFFPNASIEVEHDLLGAARSLMGKEPGLVAILGTGSNACAFDGKRIIEQRGGLGYVLGDEGSGAHLGKLLLRDLLNRDLPQELERKFWERYSEDRDQLIDQLYRGEAPSRYLAGFALFLKEQEDHEWVNALIEGAFREFVERHVLRFSGSQEGVLHSVGSIGLHFRPILEKVLKERGMALGRSFEDPLQGLLMYHGTD